MNLPITSTKSSRKHSWITHTEIAHEFPEFVTMCGNILYEDYPEQAKDYIRGILDFLLDWDYLTWKQFDSVFRIQKSKSEYWARIKKGTFIQNKNGFASISRGKLSFTCRSTIKNYPVTDLQADRLFTKVFGYPPFFKEEEEGYTISYTKKGERYFEL